MGRAPCCSKVGLRRGPWTAREDTLLTRYIQTHGEGHWRSLPKRAGLLRCGKSCRLRWLNYLRPDIKRGNIGPDEEDLIIRLHALLGNRWSLIAGRLPGRTDNEIKNYWNTHLSKRLKSKGIDPKTHHKISENQILRSQEQAQKKTKNRKIKKNEVPQSGTKIHLPKPSRATSFLKSFQSLGFADSTDRDQKQNLHPVVCDGCEEGINEDLDLPSLISDDLIFSSEFQRQIQNPTKDSMLQKLYKEYSELLEAEKEEPTDLEAFTESLWA